MTSRLNLSEMSEDLHNNPPFQISQTELGPDNSADMKTYKTGGMINHALLLFDDKLIYSYFDVQQCYIAFDKSKDILCYLRP